MAIGLLVIELLGFYPIDPYPFFLLYICIVSFYYQSIPFEGFYFSTMTFLLMDKFLATSIKMEDA